MNTQKIPFSIDKMKDAIRYETCDGREVTQVTVFDISSKYPVHGVVNGKVYTFSTDGKFNNKTILCCDLFIITEKQIEYPCLCWVSDCLEEPSKNKKGVTVMGSKNYGAVSHDHWNYSTPLTDEELAEFGLARIEK